MDINDGQEVVAGDKRVQEKSATSPKRPQGTPALLGDKLVTLRELVAQTGLPKKWVRRMVLEKDLPAVMIGNRIWYSVAAVKARVVDMAEQ